MKKAIKWYMILCNITLFVVLFYVLNLKYYDSYYDVNGNYHNDEEKIIDLVKRVIIERGGIFVWD